MRIFKGLFLFFMLGNICYAQIAQNKGVFFAKEFSKDIALYRAKSFIFNELGVSEGTVRFDLDPLAASASGELTTLVYNCIDKHRSGLILGFFGDKWNSSGVVYQAYGFKNLEKEKAVQLLGVIQKNIDDYSPYLSEANDVNNIYFAFEDMTILIYRVAGLTRLRIFWNDFDSEWEMIAFNKTQKRLAKKMK